MDSGAVTRCGKLYVVEEGRKIEYLIIIAKVHMTTWVWW